VVLTMKITPYILVLTLILRLVSADLVISEVMYNPNQCSDVECEWVELYNTGLTPINLTDYKLDGNTFSTQVLEPNKFIVVTRELVDTDDTDLESFEAVWGNNDGIWNEDFLAVQSTLSLTDNDTVTLTSPVSTTAFSYTSELGGKNNGYTLEKINLQGTNDLTNWHQSTKLNGTPGYVESNTTQEPVVQDNTVPVIVTIQNPLPVINYFNFTDEDQKQGFQVLPNYKQVKQVQVETTVSHNLGVKDVVIEVKNQTYQLTKSVELDQQSSIYSGTFDMQPTDLAGIYDLSLRVTSQDNQTTTQNITFEYLGLMSISVQQNKLDFGILNPGSISQPSNITVINEGNTVVDLELTGTDLQGSNDMLPVTSLEFGEIQYQPLSGLGKLLGSKINPGLLKSVNLRLNVPENTKPDTYTGKIQVVGVEQ